jgi:hypothetical protein
MESLKYYIDILPRHDQVNEFSFEIDQKTASEIIGFGGYNIRYIRKTYDAEVNISGDKNDNLRILKIKGKDKFKVYQKLLINL